MLCLVTLIVVGILAVGSAHYRPLAREALACVFRRITLRPCTTGLDERVRAAIAGRVMRTHPRLARFLHRRVEQLAWVFVLVFVASTALLAYGLHNFARYGSCYGPERRGFCVFDPSGARSRYSGLVTAHRGPAIPPGEGGAPSLGRADAPVVVIEFGCYTCAYTRAMQPAVDDLVARAGDDLRFVYRQFPLDGFAALAGSGVPCEPPSRGWWPWGGSEAAESHRGATRAAVAAYCADAQGRFWEMHRLLLARGCGDVATLASSAGLDAERFARCLVDPASLAAVGRDFEVAVDANLYGTPTFFVNGRMLVAPTAAALEEAVRAAGGEAGR